MRKNSDTSIMRKHSYPTFYTLSILLFSPSTFSLLSTGSLYIFTPFFSLFFLPCSHLFLSPFSLYFHPLYFHTLFSRSRFSFHFVILFSHSTFSLNFCTSLFFYILCTFSLLSLFCVEIEVEIEK